MKEEIYIALDELKKASRSIVNVSNEKINHILREIAESAFINSDKILSANQKDLDKMDIQDPKYDRLLLNPDRIKVIANDIIKVSELPSPLNIILEEKILDNGLDLKKISVPLGTIGIVFESRPNVTFDVFALCFKSGNACVLKGSRDAHHSNICIVDLIQTVLKKYGLESMVYLASSERVSLKPILEATKYIDVIIPRGSQGLIDYVREHSKVPVIETGAGIVHTYVDQSADIGKARAIIRNAKTRRVSVCNALDTLLIHEACLSSLPEIVQDLDSQFGLKIFADKEAYDSIQSHYASELLHEAEENNFGVEFLSMTLAIKTVKNMDEALNHIFNHSSKHSEAIVAEDEATVEKFLNNVDAAVVYANTSTAFTDGSQFGLGAEIGISTQKLHARGPMALKELTSYKWVVRGNGQIRK